MHCQRGTDRRAQYGICAASRRHQVDSFLLQLDFPDVRNLRTDQNPVCEIRCCNVGGDIVNLERIVACGLKGDHGLRLDGLHHVSAAVVELGVDVRHHLAAGGIEYSNAGLNIGTLAASVCGVNFQNQILRNFSVKGNPLRLGCPGDYAFDDTWHFHRRQWPDRVVDGVECLQILGGLG